MPTLQPGLSKTYQLQPGETLSITTDSASVCRYGQLIAPVGGAVGEQPSGAPISVPSNSAITVGPRGDVSRWLIDSVLGSGCNVVQNPASAVPDFGMPPDIVHLYNAGVPTAATGANAAAPGSLCTDITNFKLYIQGGSKAVPAWKLVTSA